MAKVFGPALSIDAKGKVGKGVAFQNRPRGIALIKNPVPSRKSLDDPSAAKQVQRNLVKQWILQWQAFSDNERAYWDYLAERSGLNIKGYHYWMKKKATLAFTVSHLRDYWPDMLESLVGYWAFDSDGENVAKDLSGKGNDGILKPSYPDNCPSWVDGKNYMLGKALSFDGEDDYVNCGSPSTLDDLTEFSWSVWVRPVDYADFRYIISKGISVKLLQLRSSTGYIDAIICTDGISARSTGNVAVSTTFWTHIVITYSDSGDRKIHIYVNGAEITYGTLTAATGTLTSDASNNLRIGGDAHYFNGLIDDVRIYNRALTPAEILDLYNLLK